MIEYAIGFLFSDDYTTVTMIRKKKPDWQAGKLNGVGGKIEAGEDPLQAMHREFEEETGVTGVDWSYRLVLENPDFRLHVFSAASSALMQIAKTIEDEPVINVDIDELYDLPKIDNLEWMIPMLIDPALDSGFIATLSTK